MKRTLSLTCILIFALLVAACSPAPAAEEPMPAEQESKPAAEEPTPAAQEEPMPAAEAPMPIACENSYEGKSLTLYQQAG